MIITAIQIAHRMATPSSSSLSIPTALPSGSKKPNLRPSLLIAMLLAPSIRATVVFKCGRKRNADETFLGPANAAQVQTELGAIGSRKKQLTTTRAISLLVY